MTLQYHFFKAGGTAVDYYEQYNKNKSNCGRRLIFLPDELIGRSEFPISCSVRTIYRMFKDPIFDVRHLPMKGKKKTEWSQRNS